MFCEGCGRLISEGDRVCTSCGRRVPDFENETSADPFAPSSSYTRSGFGTASVQAADSARAQVSALTQPAKQSARRSKKKRRHVKAVVAAVSIILLAAAIAVVALYTVKESQVLEVHYASGIKVSVTADTRITPYDLDGDKMVSYTVQISPVEVDDDLSWDVSSVGVEGAGGFTIADFGEIPNGVYTMEIVDNTSDDVTYYCPQIEIGGSDETASAVRITVDEDDPSSATAKPAATYSSESVSSRVSFNYYSDDEGDEKTIDATWVYPQFSCSQDNDELETLNEQLKLDYEDVLAGARENGNTSSYATRCVFYNATVTYLEGTIASIRIEQLYATNAGDLHYTITGATYNLETGTQVTPHSVFNMTDAEIEQDRVTALLAFETSYPRVKLKDDSLDYATQSFITNDGIVSVEEVSSTSSTGLNGPCEVVIASSNEALVGVDKHQSYTAIVIDSAALYGSD